MKILAIETSCDETAVSILDAHGDFQGAQFRILGNALLSQIDTHKEYGGVFPMLAKREHSRNLIPLLEKALREADMLREREAEALPHDIDTMLEREPELLAQFTAFIPAIAAPDIDVIAVTYGPGLEPALWVGINFAKALSLVWNKPIIPVNHMEGHILAGLLSVSVPTSSDEKNYSQILKNLRIENVALPVLTLLISGGHTDLVFMKEPFVYEYLGRTRDDAVGEAFDKVARLLSLPYPGGPEIERLALKARSSKLKAPFKLPRPMLRSDDYDFSFSGLKTAVLYLLKNIGEPTQEQKEQIAREFEDAVTEVLITKVKHALEHTGAKTLVIGGGVSANTHLREELEKLAKIFPELSIRVPPRELTTDNALMIAVAGYFRVREKKDPELIRAEGNLSL